MKICNSTAKIHKKLNVRVFFSPQSLRVRKEQKEIRDWYFFHHKASEYAKNKKKFVTKWQKTIEPL